MPFQILRWIGYGWIILMTAMVVNYLANGMGILTWYRYLEEISTLGFKVATLSLSPFDLLFLYLIYPGLLGLIMYLLKG